jgi:hypothetical protein
LLAISAAAGQDLTGSMNSAFGRAAGRAVIGSANSAVGFAAGQFVIGDNNVSMGNTAGNNVTGSNNVAIGSNAGSGSSQQQLLVSNTVAIGNNALASANGGVAIGNGAKATLQNQVVLGTADYTYTTPGITSATSLARQTGPVQIVTSDTNGNLATNTAAGLGLASETEISGINSRLNDIDSRTTKALNGVSMAFAMAGVPWLDRTERFAVAANWGTFQGTNGLALNAALRLGTNLQANGGIAYGVNGGGVGGRVGVRAGW